MVSWYSALTNFTASMVFLRSPTPPWRCAPSSTRRRIGAGQHGRLVIGSKNTIEAVKFVKALYQETMTPEVFSWTPRRTTGRCWPTRQRGAERHLHHPRGGKQEHDGRRQADRRRHLAGQARQGIGPADGPRARDERLRDLEVRENIEGAKKFLVDS